jgi:hypothetical protein
MLVANITSDASCTANFTMAKNFGCCFDINNPRAVMDKKLKRGETMAQYSNDIIVGKWKDKRDVLYLLRFWYSFPNLRPWRPHITPSSGGAV